MTKTYRALFGGAHEALSGLTLSIPRGAAFGLIGPNGAGKTTFIKVLLGVVQATSGEVTVLGGAPGDVPVRARIGYLPERMHLPAALSARQFLRSVATLKGLAPSDGELSRALERVGLANDGQRIGSFSKGMRQRLGLAAAMLGAPELLILDEPTDGIDPVGRVEVRQLLLEERARGVTLLLNSHLLSETERVCDRVGVLQRGQLRLEGTLDEVRRGATAFRARFEAGADEGALRAAGFVDGVFSGDVAALNEALDRARATGARLVALSPVERDLEQVLSEAMKEAS
ncbi:MAG: ABC transporter ATP-binding protein [Myxococcaceae bacterium]|nr:ABC transporter ATP-binding protein [Myxococcaceae bacterium]MCA3011209.1 ABC transporter ATP-binding protein [Myxococcaceae bacterium]